MNKISIIVPCYNKEEALPSFHEEATRILDGIGLDYEILLINDGSKDQTLRVIKELASHNNKIKYLSFSRNFGKEAAMYAGFCNAGGDYVGVMDADMQDPPQLLPQMLKILQGNEYGSVATRRVGRTGEPLMSLGVIGQYIAKTYLETKSRPHYIIAETNKDNVKTVN